MFEISNSKEINKKIDWKEAIKEGVKILQKNGQAKKELFDAILKVTREYGAYYVLEKGIALAHAPVGKYNLKPGISLVYLKENIQFNGEDKWAKLIITLSAIDGKFHMKLIEEFATVFGNHSLKEKLLKTTSLQEFLQVYKKGGN